MACARDECCPGRSARHFALGGGAQALLDRRRKLFARAVRIHSRADRALLARDHRWRRHVDDLRDCGAASAMATPQFSSQYGSRRSYAGPAAVSEIFDFADVYAGLRVAVAVFGRRNSSCAVETQLVEVGGGSGPRIPGALGGLFLSCLALDPSQRDPHGLA